MLLERASNRHLAYLKDELNRTAGTVKNYRQTHRLFITFLSEALGKPPAVTDLTLETGRAFLLWLSQEHYSIRWGGGRIGHSPANIIYHRRVLRSWAAWMVEEELLPASPVHRLRGPKAPQTVPRLLNRQQVDTLLELCRANPLAYSRYRNAALFTFLPDTGVRVTEACNIKLDDIQLATKTSAGRALIAGKGRRQRYVTLGLDASRTLRRYWDETRPKGAADWAFLSDAGKQMNQKSVDAILKRLADKAGIDESLAHAHAYRHFYAVEALRAGLSLADVSHQLGHASIRETARYLMILKDDPDAPHISVMDVLKARRKASR